MYLEKWGKLVSLFKIVMDDYETKMVTEHTITF